MAEFKKAYPVAPTWIEPLTESRLESPENHLVSHSFLDEHWRQISECYHQLFQAEGQRSEERAPDQLRTFVYWDKGFAQAPDLVKTCHAVWQRTLGESLVSLSDENIHEYVDIPEHLNSYREHYKAQFSDWLRLSLLSRHGGSWVDATTYPGVQYANLLKSLRLESRHFFAPERRDRALASAFMWSNGHSHIVRMMLAGLNVYMQNYSRPFHYFQFHYIFGALLMRDPLFHSEFYAGRKMDGHAFQHLWRIRNRPYRGNEVRAALRRHPVHKLSYKFGQRALLRGSVLDHFLKHGTLWHKPKSSRMT